MRDILNTKEEATCCICGTTDEQAWLDHKAQCEKYDSPLHETREDFDGFVGGGNYYDPADCCEMCNGTHD